MVWWRLCASRERRWAGLGDARDERDAIWALSCGGGGAGQGFRGELRSGTRHGSACSSPWRVDGRPRRARREMAPRGEAERLRENQRRGKRRGRGAWPCRRRDGNAVNVKQRREMVVGQFRN